MLFCDNYFDSLTRKEQKNILRKQILIKYGSDYLERCELRDLTEKLRSRCSAAFRNLKLKKKFHTHELLGADYIEIKKHLEDRFLDEMTWSNCGRGGWHIDHIIPLAIASNEKELIKLLNYKNLQPLWESDNSIKGSKHNGVRYNYKNRDNIDFKEVTKNL